MELDARSALPAAAITIDPREVQLPPAPPPAPSAFPPPQTQGPPAWAAAGRPAVAARAAPRAARAALGAAAAALVLLLASEVDRAGSRRTLKDQYVSSSSWLFSLINAPIHLGTRAAYRGLPILPINQETFPNVRLLREAYDMLREEALGALDAAAPIKGEQFFTKIADDGWKRFYLKWYGPCDPQAQRLCPRTCALLERMPNVHLAMFSILEPGSRILPHCGPFRGCLRYHMGICTPNDDRCFIDIGGQRYSWRDGEDVLFDDTFRHYVVNDTDQVRIVLFLDVERPMAPGPLAAFASLCVKHLGKLTTRANDRTEARSKQRGD